MQLRNTSDVAVVNVRLNVFRFSDIINQLKVDVCYSTCKCAMADFFPDSDLSFISFAVDGAHTLTCALMLLNTDLHGHVCTGVLYLTSC